LGQIYAWASPDYIFKMDWRLVFMYGDFACEKLYGVKRKSSIMEKPDLEAIRKMRMGKIIRPGSK